jgi:hypothetical protein
MYDKSEINDFLFSVSFLVFVFVPLFAGPALLVVDVYMWLDSGKWAPVETIWLLKTFPEFASWIENPRSWFGAHEIIKPFLALPLGICLLPIGFWFWAWLVTRFDSERH